MFSKVRRLKQRLNQINELTLKIEELQKAVGHIALELDLRKSPVKQNLREYEFKVFSQWGEDGIIQHLIHSVPIVNTKFVEFGVQDYKESNTRFLLQHDNWSGLIIDGSEEYIRKVKAESIYYRNDLRAVCAFIDKDNINSLLKESGYSGDIGILSIDIDGNDYWVWEAIDCVNPRIVICEYDSLLGSERAVVTPYKRDFIRIEAHYSFLYGGASIVALERLGKKKGYSLVGSNSAGNNLFFVRSDLTGNVKIVTAREAYVKARFRNSRDQNGELTFLSFEDSLLLIKDLPLVDLENNEVIRVKDIIPKSHQ